MKLNNKLRVGVFYYPECEEYKCELHIGVNSDSKGGYSVTELKNNLTLDELITHIKTAIINEIGGGKNEIQK